MTAAEKQAADKAPETIQFSQAFVPAETFETTVTIPVLGKEPVKVKMTFKTSDPDDYTAKLKADIKSDAPMADFLAELIVSWDEKVMGVAYSREALTAISKKNNAVSTSIIDAYQRAIITGRVGN